MDDSKEIIKNLDKNDIKLIYKLYNFITNGNKDKKYTDINPIIGKSSVMEDGVYISKHSLGAAMVNNDRRIVYGISSNSPFGYDVHGEGAVISQAHIVNPDANMWKTMVCLVPPKIKDTIQIIVKSSCGACRELLRYQYPNIYVIVPDPTNEIAIKKPKDIPTIDLSSDYKTFSDYIKTLGLVKIKAKYLLPYPYINSDILEASRWDKNINFSLKKK
jgi:cytidine deaminase